MKFNFSAIYVDQEMRVIKVVETIKPYRFSGVFLNIKIGVIELAVTTIEKNPLKIDDQLKISY